MSTCHYDCEEWAKICAKLDAAEAEIALARRVVEAARAWAWAKGELCYHCDEGNEVMPCTCLDSIDRMNKAEEQVHDALAAYDRALIDAKPEECPGCRAESNGGGLCPHCLHCHAKPEEKT